MGDIPSTDLVLEEGFVSERAHCNLAGRRPSNTNTGRLIDSRAFTNQPSCITVQDCGANRFICEPAAFSEHRAASDKVANLVLALRLAAIAFAAATVASLDTTTQDATKTFSTKILIDETAPLQRCSLITPIRETQLHRRVANASAIHGASQLEVSKSSRHSRVTQ